MFLKDHEEELLHIFREELQRLDDEIPEENLFINIRMVPLGETIVKAVLRAVNRFLTEDVPVTAAVGSSADEAIEEATAVPIEHRG
jgi:hypothetical protein